MGLSLGFYFLSVSVLQHMSELGRNHAHGVRCEGIYSRMIDCTGQRWGITAVQCIRPTPNAANPLSVNDSLMLSDGMALEITGF